MAIEQQIQGVRLGQVNKEEFDAAYVTQELFATELAKKADSNGSSDVDTSAKVITVSEGVIPSHTSEDSEVNIGSETELFDNVYTKTVVASDSVQLGDTQVLVEDTDEISGKKTVVLQGVSDEDINIKTLDNGSIDITSGKDINVSGTGNVNVSGKLTTISGTNGVVVDNELVAKEASTFKKNVTVEGDLFVKGTTTKVNSTTVEVSDNVIEVNKDEVGDGVTSGIAGIEVNRGTADNQLFVWDEADDRFKMGASGSLKNVASTNDIEEYVNSANIQASKVVTTDELNFVSSTEKTAIANVDNKVDKEEGKVLSSNDFTDELKAKLDGIEANANKFVMPTLTASDISTDTAHQFVTATEKSTWNNKAEKPTILEGTLTVGSTNVTLTSDKINDDAIIDIYTDKYGINPKSVTTADGTITLSFGTQTTEVRVRVVIQ